MIQRILDFFNQQFNDSVTEEQKQHQLKLASAALLVEMIRMDHKIEAIERDTVISLLKKDFSLSDDETTALFELAEIEADNAVDYYRFAQLINDHYENEYKFQIIENLWQVAYADGELDKYEEHYLRKVADILHIPHREFIQAKHRVQKRVSS